MTVITKYEGPKIQLDPIDLWCEQCGTISTRFFPPNVRPTSLSCSTPHCEAIIRHSLHKPNLHARLLDFDLALKALKLEKQTEIEITDQKKQDRELEEQQKAQAESEKQAELVKKEAKFKRKLEEDESGNPFYGNFDGSRDYNVEKSEEKPENPPE